MLLTPPAVPWVERKTLISAESQVSGVRAPALSVELFALPALEPGELRRLRCLSFGSHFCNHFPESETSDLVYQHVFDSYFGAGRSIYETAAGWLAATAKSCQANLFAST